MLTPEDLVHLCKLARLRIADDEAARLLGDLERILGYVESLNELDGETTATPMTDLDIGTDHYRDDVARPSPPREEALSNAPAVVDDHFAVPTVVDYGSGAGGTG